MSSDTWPWPLHGEFEARLQEAASRWFAAKGYPVRRRQPYILDRPENWPRNIILSEVAHFIKRQIAARRQRGQGFALHRYVHHGLSSQALLFNLAGPLVISDDYEPLHRALAEKGLHWPAGPWDVSFEFEARSIFGEEQRQPTSIDLVIRGASGASIFVECKLAETGFGGCSVYSRGDCAGANPSRDFSSCYLHHIGRRYWTLMKNHGLVAGPVLTDSQCALARHYQFFRELTVALEMQGVFVLLHDERSPTFCFSGLHGQYGLMPLLLQLVPGQVRRHVGIISVQRLVEHIKASGRHPWISIFEAKYGLVEANGEP